MFIFQAGNGAGSTVDLARIQELTLSSIQGIFRSIAANIPYIIAGLIVFLLFWLLSKLVKSIFLKASRKTRLDDRLRILFSRLIAVGIVAIGFFTALTVFTKLELGNVIAGLGFTSFIIGFATKDILNNLLSGVLILWQQPFRIGDYLFVGSNQGKVEYIGVRATKLRKDDGELVLIPNGDMYSSAITIRGAGAERRMLLKICIDYAADVTNVKSAIGKVLEDIDGVVEQPAPSVFVTDLTGDGINISVYFWINTDTHKPMAVFDDVATKVKRSLANDGVELFPPGSIVVQKAPSSEVLPQKKNDL